MGLRGKDLPSRRCPESESPRAGRALGGMSDGGGGGGEAINTNKGGERRQAVMRCHSKHANRIDGVLRDTKMEALNEIFCNSRLIQLV